VSEGGVKVGCVDVYDYERGS